MKPHETFELIVSLVCARYNLHWREVLCYFHNKTQRDVSQAKKIITHLSGVFLGQSFVEEVIGVHVATLHKHNSWCKNNPEQINGIRELVKASRNAKNYYINKAA